MGKFDGILMCTDLDGTFLRNDKSISEENLAAIRYFSAEGGLFTFVTGRIPNMAEYIYDAVGTGVPVGCFNGAAIYDFAKKKFLWHTTLPHSVMELVKYVEEHVKDVGVQVNVLERAWYCRDNEAMIEFRKITGQPHLVCDYDQIDEPIAKVIFGHVDSAKIELIRDLLAAHPRAAEFDYIRSETTLFEILPHGVSKGGVLLKLAEVLGIDPARTVAVGDYDNDVSMIRAAGVGIAVSNACDKAKAVADLITVSNEEHAIARIISDLDSGVISI